LVGYEGGVNSGVGAITIGLGFNGKFIENDGWTYFVHVNCELDIISSSPSSGPDPRSRDTSDGV